MEAIYSPTDEQRHGEARRGRPESAAEESRRFFLPFAPPLLHYSISILPHAKRERKERKKARAANELRTAP